MIVWDGTAPNTETYVMGPGDPDGWVQERKEPVLIEDRLSRDQPGERINKLPGSLLNSSTEMG
jgi:hypothetical protein